MKLVISILFFLTTTSLISQISYTIPKGRSYKSIDSIQFDFSSLKKMTYTIDLTSVLDDFIQITDTNSVYYFTGFESYKSFKENEVHFGLDFPEEMKKNFYVFDLNGDDSLDLLYDRVNHNWDYQSINSMLKTPQGWRKQKIPGFIIVDTDTSNGRLNKFETYQWACCNYPFDNYFHLEQKQDSVQVLSKTVFHRKTELPKLLKFNNIDDVITSKDSISIYSLWQGKMEKVHALKGSFWGEVIEERQIGLEHFSFVRLRVSKKYSPLDFNFFMGWVRTLDLEKLMADKYKSKKSFQDLEVRIELNKDSTFRMIHEHSLLPIQRYSIGTIEYKGDTIRLTEIDKQYKTEAEVCLQADELHQHDFIVDSKNKLKSKTIYYGELIPLKVGK